METEPPKTVLLVSTVDDVIAVLGNPHEIAEPGGDAPPDWIKCDDGLSVDFDTDTRHVSRLSISREKNGE